MKKLFHILFLTCKQASYFLSISNLKKPGLFRQLQLGIHLSMCKSCHEFSHQSRIIDESLEKFGNPAQFISEESLTEEKKTEIKTAVLQVLKN